MTKKQKMTVIGFGRMGQYYTKIFSDGFEVTVISSRNIKNQIKYANIKSFKNIKDGIKNSDYIFCTVPLDALDSVIKRINNYVKPSTVFIDCCSARVGAEKKTANLKCHHFGIHGNIIIGSPDPNIIEYLNVRGFRFRQMLPEEHDIHNTIFGLVHFIGFVMNDYLTDSEKKYLKDSPVGSYLNDIIEHLKRNALATYRETQLENQQMKNRRQDLINTMQKYHEGLSNGEFPFIKL